MNVEEFHRLAVVLCLDVPEKSEFGIDLQCWMTGPKFKGVKLIPEGPHIIYYSVTNEKYGNQRGARLCRWLHLKSGDIVVKRWDAGTEDFLPSDALDAEDTQRYQSGVRNLDFDRELGPYPQELFSEWKPLSDCISPEVLQRLEPLNKRISSEAAKERSQYIDINNCSSFFVPIPRRRTAAQHQPLSGHDLTKQNMDKSFMLEDLLREQYQSNPLLLLGELQYAFIVFLIGEEYNGFEQWKAMVHLLCGCMEALSHRAAMFLKFIDILRVQLNRAPDDFFADPLLQRNFLVSDLRQFFELLNDDSVPHDLQQAAVILKRAVEARFKVSFTVAEIGADDDEDAPVVVDVENEG